MSKTFTSGNPDTKSDFYIEYKPATSGSIKVDMQSKTQVLHGLKLNKTVINTLSDLGIKNGDINVLDVVAAVNFVLGSATPSDSQACASDFNGDGVINVLDIVLMVNIIFEQ